MGRSLSRCLILLLSTLCFALQSAPCSAATIADSQDDWSADGVQGENGWFNGWYNYTADDDQIYAVDEFQPFVNDDSGFVDFDGLNNWDGGQWVLYRDTQATAGADTGPWTRIGSDFGHPNGENSAAAILVDEPEIAEHWAIRRWVSPVAGELSLTSFLADSNVNCGNGTTVHLFHNGELIDTLATSSATGVQHTVGRTINVGDMLDLALTPVGPDEARGDSCDSSLYRLTVGDEPPPPTPVLLADSFDDWSTTGTQGEKNWFNGYYNLTQDDDGDYQVDDFIPFSNDEGPAGGPVDPDGNHWTGTQYDLTQEAIGPWTELGQQNTHPNGTNSDPNEEHWTIRRFVANDLTSATSLDLTWEMAKTNVNGGTGVTGILLVNGEEVDTATIDGTDGTGVVRTVSLVANPGDVFDLALTPNGADGSDGSRNRLTLFIAAGGRIGDFNNDGVLDAADIDDLTGQSAGGLNPPPYDLNNDSLVDAADVNVWIRDLFNSWVGDADLNGEFNSGDLVVVLSAGTYETGAASVWSTGDFNGDGQTDSGDLVAALSDGGYELGPRAAVSAVPEPGSLVLVSSALLLLAARRRR